MPERTQGDRLAHALATLLGPAAKHLEPRKLGGGIGHTSYLVTHAEQSYVLRLKHEPTPGLLTLEEEFGLLTAAAAAGISAEPMRMDSATGALLIRYVRRANTLTEVSAREAANISRLAALLRRLHAIAAPLRDFAPRAHAENYVAAAAQRAPLTPAEQGMADELHTLAADYAMRYPPSAVCHNDLVAANVLDAGELLLIDFEYAARAAPILDLASLAAMTQLSARKGYRLVAVEPTGVNAFFLRNDVAPEIPACDPAHVYRIPDKYNELIREKQLDVFKWARESGRELVDVG